MPAGKLHYLVESGGGVVVGEEACVGERNFRDLLPEFASISGDTQGSKGLAFPLISR
jgi:hypothetical protein